MVWRFGAPYELNALEGAGIVVVPAWRNPQERPGEPVLAALRAAHADGAVIVGLCLGAFVLAAAGLLDGRRAATHWAFTGALAAAYPDVTVDAAALFVDEGDVLTSAGAAAGIDACLHLVRRTIGAGAAAAIARRMVVSPASQRHPGAVPRPTRARARRRRHVRGARPCPGAPRLAPRRGGDGGSSPHEQASLRPQVPCGRRRLPMRWLLHQRVLHAQRLLEGTDLSVDAIARHVGLGAGVSLRPHFRRQVGISPQAYRQAFRAIDASGRLT